MRRVRPPASGEGDRSLKNALPLFALLFSCTLTTAALFHACTNLNVANTYYLQNGVFTVGGGPCMNVSADNVTVDCAGFKIYGTDKTIDIAINNSEGHANLTVVNCTFSLFYAAFYEKKTPDNATYTNNFVNTSAYSIFAYNATNHYVSNLTVWSGGEVYLNNATNFSIARSNFTNVTQGAAGFSTYAVRAVSGSRAVTFDGNLVNEYEAGIYDFMTDATSNGNTVKNSVFSGSNGTRIDNASQLVFYNNTVYNVSAYSLYVGHAGAFPTSSGVNVSNNNFSYAQTGAVAPCVSMDNATGVAFNNNNLVSCGIGGAFFNSTVASGTFGSANAVASGTFGSANVTYNKINLTGFSTGNAVTFQANAYAIDANDSLNVSYNNMSNVASALQVLSLCDGGQHAVISWNSFIGNNASNYTGVCTQLRAVPPTIAFGLDSNANIDHNTWSNNYCEGAATTNRHYGLVMDCEAQNVAAGSCTIWNNRFDYNTVKTARHSLYLYANTVTGTANSTVQNNYGFGNYFNNSVAGYALVNMSCDASGTTGTANVLENSTLDSSSIANSSAYVQRAGLNLTNSTHNKSATGVASNGAFIIGQWYFNLRALRQDGVALADTNVSMNDSTGAAVFYNLTTNATGDIARQNITEYYKDNHITTNYTDPNGHWVNGSTLAYMGGAYKYMNRYMTQREDLDMYFGECSRIVQNTTLEDDQYSAGTCFNITADNVVLNCKGHSITGNFSADESGGYGVATSRENATIVECIITGFYDGVHLDKATNATVLHSNSSYNINSALYMRDSNASATNSSLNGTYGPAYSDFNLTASNATSLNTSFNKSSSAFADASSTLVAKWFLDVRVLDETGSETRVSLNVDATGNNSVNDSGMNERNGHAWLQVREYWQNSSFVLNYTPHNVTAWQQMYFTPPTFRFGAQYGLNVSQSGNATVALVVCGNGVCATGIEDCGTCPIDCDCGSNPPIPSPTAKPSLEPSVKPTAQPSEKPTGSSSGNNTKNATANVSAANATQTLNLTTQKKEIEQKCVEGEMQTYKVERSLLVIQGDDGKIRTLVNLTVENAGNQTLREIAIDEQLPESVAYSSVLFSKQPDQVDGNKVAWVVESLAPGESVNFFYYADGALSFGQFGQIHATANKTGETAATTLFNLDVGKWDLTNYALAATLGIEAVAGYWFIKRKKKANAAKAGGAGKEKENENEKQNVNASKPEDKNGKNKKVPGAGKEKPAKKR